MLYRRCWLDNLLLFSGLVYAIELRLALAFSSVTLVWTSKLSKHEWFTTQY